MKIIGFLLASMVFVTNGYSQIFKGISNTNFSEYISADPNEAVYVGLNFDIGVGGSGAMTATLKDLNAGTTTPIDVKWLFDSSTTLGWSGVNRFIFTKGILSNDSDIYLIYLNNGDGTGNWSTYIGGFQHVYFFNMRTKQRMYQQIIPNSVFSYKSADLIFSSSGTYFSVVAYPDDVAPYELNILYKLNDINNTVGINGLSGNKRVLYKKTFDISGRKVVNGKHIILF